MRKKRCEMSVLARVQHKDWTTIQKSCLPLTYPVIPLSRMEGNMYRAVCEFIV